MNRKVNQIIFFGFIFHVFAAIFSIGHHHCDELFQIFEFAGYKLGLNQADQLPWEFSAQMRSGLQPFLVYVITHLCQHAGLHNPFHVAVVIRLLQAVFSFYVMLRFIHVLSQYHDFNKSPQSLYFFAFLFWCMPYFHARFSSENFSSALFFFGLSLLIDAKAKHKSSNFLFGGLFFGLAFIVRFQIGFMLAGYIAWMLFVQKVDLKKISLIFSGIFTALILGFLCDYWLYGTPVCSWWNYLHENVFQNKAGEFGTSPFYFYFIESFVQLIPPFSLLIIFAVLIYFIKNPKSVFTWLAVPFIILHIVVPHKELRFLFPLLYLLPVFMAAFFQYIGSKNESKLVAFFTSGAFIKTALIINGVLLLVFSFKPADDETQLFHTIYNVVGSQPSTLFYEARNPYNNQAGLNYFRSKQVHCIELYKDSVIDLSRPNYFFRDGFHKEMFVVKNTKVFVKVYANLPDWIDRFNFSGWLQRANSYCIYKEVK